MSGDIQPRKRKDKRRKKEGSSIGAVHEPVSFQKHKRSESDDVKVFDVPDQGEKIHIQNEHGVGGNICVKIIFFCLFGLLVGAVGLIYLKSLGSTDVDLPTVEESRFAEYFTGWLDDGHDDHEHETPENSLNHDHDDHDEHSEHDDEEEHDHEDHEEDEEHENEEEDQNSEQDSIYKLFGLQEDDTDDVEESEMKEKEMTESELGINQNVDDDDDDDDDDDNDDQEDEEEEEEEEEKEKSEMEDEEESDMEDNENEDDDEEKSDVENNENEDDEDEEDNESGIDLTEKVASEDEEEDEDLSQVDEEDESKYKGSHLSKDVESSETKQSGEEDDIKNDDDDDDDDDDDEDEGVEQDGDENEENQEYEETDEVEKEDKGEDSKETGKPKIKADSEDLGFEEIDVSEEDLEDQHKLKHKGDSEGDTEEKTEKSSNEEEEEEDADEADTGGVALRLGVGIALIVVAHLVLVKKWRSMSNATVDENTTTGIESTVEKKEVENLHSSFEPVISRRQTLVPEDVCLNEEGEEEEEMEEEEEVEEEEEEEEDEEQEEEKKEDDLENENDIHPEKPYVEEEIKNLKKDNWETFEKPSWNIHRSQFEDEDDEDPENEEIGEEEEEEVEDEEDDVEEIEEEQEEEEEEEEAGDEDEDEDEDDVDIEDDNDFVKHKFHQTVPEDREEEIIKETAPVPPPRTKPGRGSQEFQEFIDRFEEFNEIEDPIQDRPKGEEPNNNSGPEEQKTPESKVGNEDEWTFRQEFDIAEEQFENNPKAAVEAYEKIISKKPDLIRALIGHARALDHWAEKEKSNTHLKKAINSYKNVLLNQGHRLDEETYVKLAERCIERMRFAGALVSAIEIHKALILKYPNTPKYRNMLAVTYLMLNKIPQARVLLNETLSLWPGNGFALVHYGFILKTSDNNMEEGAKKLMAGIQTREEGVIDGMFFFHLGDALNRLGRAKEAMEWYELGVKEGLFLSKYQRSLYNVNRLKGQPWWTKKETTYQDFFKKLEDNWREIRREGLELLNSKGVNLFKEEAENLKDTGDWKQLDLYFRGRKQVSCNKAPVTCSLVSSFKPASSCTRGQIKFSVMLPNTHVWPHCGPTNCRLRSHLGLVVPKGTFIRVAEETRSWEEGKFIIFDDSFEHEVWHNGTGPRLVLIVDVWHPELTNQERRYLSPI